MGRRSRCAAVAVLAGFCCVPDDIRARQEFAYQIGGQVVDVSGAARPGARVCAFPFDRGPAFGADCARSGADGGFVVRARVSGRYLVGADDPASGHHSTRRDFYRFSSTPAAEAVLDEINPVATVRVVLAPANGTLIITAHDAESGWPVELLRLVLCHAASPGICHLVDERREDGRFTIPAPHEPFTLQALSPEHELWAGPPGGDERDAIYIGSGETTEMRLQLRRRQEYAGKPINELEKQLGVHLPAPVQVSPDHRAVLRVLPRSTTLEWRPVPGAASYTVEVDFCDGRSRSLECFDPSALHRDHPPMTGITSTRYEFTFIGAQPGRWRVFAIDGQGRAGFKSRWRTFIHER